MKYILPAFFAAFTQLMLHSAVRNWELEIYYPLTLEILVSIVVYSKTKDLYKAVFK